MTTMNTIHAPMPAAAFAENGGVLAETGGIGDDDGLMLGTGRAGVRLLPPEGALLIVDANWGADTATS